MAQSEQYYIHDLDPMLWSSDELSLPWYWLSYLVGFFFIYFLAEYAIKRKLSPLNLEHLKKALVINWFSMIIGARLFYVVFYYPSLYIDKPYEIFAIWKGGMSFHGGIVGIAFSSFLYTKSKKIPIFQISDLIVFGLGAGIMLGRLSNFVNAELVGRPTQLPWAVIFPNYDLLPRHPSQIYEAIGEGLILLILMWVNRNKLKSPGLLTSIFFIYYSSARFLIEFTREADRQIGYLSFGLSFGQYLSLIMLILGLFAFKHIKAHGKIA